METPLEIDFQGMQGNDALRTHIVGRVDALERRFGRITAGRVVIKDPGGHHRTGAPFEVSIRLALPNGKEVEVSDTPQDDERLRGLTYAINDAFRRARRQLQDEARKLQGAVKQHEAVPTATVARLDREGGFGFLSTGDGREIYFHRNSVLDDKFAKLEAGMRVAFHEEVGEKGPQASTVRLLPLRRAR